VADLTGLVSEEALTADEVNRCYDLDGGFFKGVTGAVIENLPQVDLASVSLCSPVPRPGKVICIGLNYRDHAEESGMAIPQSPLIFSKFSSCVTGPGEDIILPAASSQVDYEAELAVVLKSRLKNATPEEALKAVWGFTCCNDVTARDLQKTDGQWTRAKGFDTFCPLGPWLVTDFVEKNQKITCRLNGEVKQSAAISDRMRNTAELLSFVSKVMTLEPLDVLTTGTPAGIGPMKVGDVAEVEIEGIGVLRNQVANER
jgi:2-keto-4-pentenoate hydratase/2-oxohepta-3-ene-1,7-dioic acid hydratase in catechol pathway